MCPVLNDLLMIPRISVESALLFVFFRLAIHYLLEVCGLSPHVRDRNLSTPLHIVCAHGHVEAFEYFLKKEVRLVSQLSLSFRLNVHASVVD
jgi:ankyrin repeat protein